MARKPHVVLSPQEATMAKAKRNAEKSARFVKIAKARTSKAIKSISLLQNLANRGSYVYSKKQTDQIVNALAKALQGVAAKFAADGVKSESGFEFTEE